MFKAKTTGERLQRKAWDCIVPSSQESTERIEGILEIRIKMSEKK